MTPILRLLSIALLISGCYSFHVHQPNHQHVPRTDTNTQSSMKTLLHMSAAEQQQQISEGEGLTAEQEHAREVFFSLVEEKDGTKKLGLPDLGNMLHALDIDASEEEAEALFKYLDSDGSGQISFGEFLPWYSEAAEAAKESASVFQGIIQSRRTVDRFDETPVDDAVLRRAVECAIAAPNRRLTEPWRFVRLGPDTVSKLTELKRNVDGDEGSFQQWTKIPGWCVVTYKRYKGDNWAQREDFKSVCCAVENFMLSMWSEGIGSKWTDGPIQRTPEFAEICGIDTEKEKVAGVIWYGFASGGLGEAVPKTRKKGVNEILGYMP